MAAAVVAPSRIEQGEPLTFAATGFAISHAISLVVTSVEGGVSLHDVAVTDGAGAYTWDQELETEGLGHISYSVTDGTSTVTGDIQSWA